MNVSTLISFILAIPILAAIRTSFRIGPTGRRELLCLGSQKNGYKLADQNRRLPDNLYTQCVPFAGGEICRAEPSLYDRVQGTPLEQPFKTDKFEFVDWDRASALFAKHYTMSVVNYELLPLAFAAIGV